MCLREEADETLIFCNAGYNWTNHLSLSWFEAWSIYLLAACKSTIRPGQVRSLLSASDPGAISYTVYFRSVNNGDVDNDDEGYSNRTLPIHRW